MDVCAGKKKKKRPERCSPIGKGGPCPRLHQGRRLAQPEGCSLTLQQARPGRRVLGCSKRCRVAVLRSPRLLDVVLHLRGHQVEPAAGELDVRVHALEKARAEGTRDDAHFTWG